MAAPHVAGARALMKSKQPSASVTEILNALIATGTPIRNPGNGLVFPRLNVDTALATLPSPCGFAINPVSVGPQGGTMTVSIAAPPNCPWTATSLSPFITIASGRSGFGPGHLVLSLSSNQSQSGRAGLITVADTSVTVAQRGLHVVQGDMNGDGHGDIFWQNLADGSLGTWWLDGSNVIGFYRLGIPRVTDTNWRVVGAGDLNGDGNVDLVWRHQTEGWIGVWYLAGCEVLSSQYLSIDRVTDLDWQIRGVGDLDGDGKADLIWQHATQGLVAAWLMDGSQVLSTTSLSLPRTSDLHWQIVGAGDTDNDGRADIIWRHDTEGWLGVWRMDGINVVRTEFLSFNRLPDLNWHIRAVGDANGDGFADLIWENDATGQLGVWFLNGAVVISQRLLSIDNPHDLNWRVVGPG
jgi:hypothetical protein